MAYLGQVDLGIYCAEVRERQMDLDDLMMFLFRKNRRHHREFISYNHLLFCSPFIIVST